MGLLALKQLVSMRRQGRQTQSRRCTSTASVSVANRKRSRCHQDGDPQAAKRTRHSVPEPPKGSSSSDEVGSFTENNSFEASEAKLQNFDSCEIEEENCYVDDEDEGCYDDEYEPDYEFDGSDFNQELDYKFDDLDLPPGVEASVPLLQKAVTDDGPGNFKSMSEIEK